MSFESLSPIQEFESHPPSGFNGLVAGSQDSELYLLGLWFLSFSLNRGFAADGRMEKQKFEQAWFRVGGVLGSCNCCGGIKIV